MKPTAALLALLVFAGVALAPPVRADEATDKARSRYETGLELFYAREHAQALIEFQRAHELKPRPATLFMMAQCEYLLGSLRIARDHYEAYLRESPSGEFVEVAKDRVEAINRRTATLVINTAPDQVDVRLTPVLPAPSPEGAQVTRTVAPITGQAPNNFSVPRGRWLVSVSKVNYLSQRAEIEVDVADSKHLFFKLDPIPARLDIETVPAGATLYVNGNRARNPYHQNVAPGRYEIFAEATNRKDRTEEFVLGPGDRRSFEGLRAFHLQYVQRSGRPELLAASSILGGLVGAGAVAAALGTDATDPRVATAGLFLGGALAGTLTGGLIANRVVPSYIPDNRALFILGGMWVGAAEGALTGMIIRQSQASSVMDPELGTYRQVPTDLSSAAFLGSLPGLAVGATTGALLSRRAPTYGRVALIQSATLGGGIAGMLGAAALQWNPFGWQRRVQTVDSKGIPIGDGNVYHLDSDRDPSLPALIGLNVGLGVGLLGAYLPNQSRYGPTWKRIGLIDLATIAGLFAGGIAGCVSADDCVGAITADSSSARARSSSAALLGGTIGALAGILLTRDVDRDLPSEATVPPTVTLFPVRDIAGGTTPAVGAVGFF